jgi:hypothetical protein
MATFNADAALKAGYTELQIAEFLGQQNKFNTAAALQAGYAPADIIKQLSGPPPTTFGGQTKEFFKGIPSGAVNLLESAATGASALLPEEMEKSARKTISETAAAAKKPFEAARGYEETIPRKFGEAVGSTAPFFLLGPAGLAGRVSATGLGVGAGAGEARTRAEQEGATGGQRAGATALGAVVGVTEMLPVFRFIDNLASPIKKGIMGTLTRAAATGGAEGLQEAAAQIAQNLIAKGVYKPDQAIIEQVGESAAYGTATGALVQVLTDMALGRRAGQGSSTPAGKPTDLEAEQQAKRLAVAQEQMGVKQGREARAGEKLLNAEEREAAKAEALAQKERLAEMDRLNAEARAQREADLKAAFPTDYADVMQRTDNYVELSKELDAISGSQTKEAKARRGQIQARMQQIVEEDTRVPRELKRIQDDQERLAKQAGFPAKKSAAAFEAAPPQMEMREAMLEPGQELPPQRDLQGNIITPEAPVAEPTKRFPTFKNEVDARRGMQRGEAALAKEATALRKEQEAAGQMTLAPRVEPKVTEQPVTPEPTLVQKPEALTPTTVPTTVTPDVLGALGIGRTAIIRKPDHGIMGKDIADPAQAAEVKSILEAYRQGRSAPIQEKIDAYLARPEFEAVKGETDARQIEPPTDRNGVQVSDQTGERKPARRTLTVKRNGVVSPKSDVGQPIVGEAEQSTPVEEVQPPAPPAEPKKPMGMFDQLVQPDTTEPIAEEEAPAVEEVKFDPWDPKNYKGLAQEIEKESTRSKEEAAQDLIDEKKADRESKKSIKVKSKPVQEAVEEESTAEKDVRAEATVAAVKTLTGADKMVLAKHYKQPKFNKVAETSFVDDTIKAINEGIESVSKAIHKYVRKAMSGMLSVALVINPAFMGLPEAAIISSPATYTVEQAVKATIPAEAAKLMSPAAKTAYETILPAIKADLQARDKLFIINDKPSARTFLFTPDGQLLMQSKTLQGIGVGDLYKGNNDIVANRVTPAGLFNIEQRVGGKTAGEYDFGKVFGINDTEAFITIMHSVWTKEADAPQRLKALNNDSAADSRYSFGCINVPTATFKQMLEKHENQMNGAKMFIVPDNQARVKDFISGDIAKNTVREDKLLRQSVEPVTEKVTKTTSGAGNVQAGVDRTLYGKPEERFSRQAVVQGQTVQELTDEITKGKGVLANALRRMVQSGKVRLEEKHPSGEKIGGYFDGKTITLYADGIPSGDAMAVALHEVGAHLGLKNLLGVQQYNNVIKRIQAMATSKEASPARALAQRALSRIQQEDIVRGDEVIGDESVAYFIEELAKAQARGELQTLGPARALWNQIKAAIQATINRVFGTNLGVDAFTPEQIGLLANAAFTKESFTAPKEGTADLASRTEGFTDAFRKWFGNSKVVDAKGAPQVVYHTGRFDSNEIISGAEKHRRSGATYPIGNEGIYFTDNPEYSAMYGRGEGQTMYPVYLSLQNPFVIEDQAQMSKLEKLKQVVLGKKQLPRNETNTNPRTDSMYITPEYKAKLIAMGYDGIINKPYTEIVAFEPTQIKSAIGNRGTYDINNPDIRFSRAQGFTPQDYDEVNRIANSYGPAAAPAVGGLLNDSLKGMNRAAESSGLFTAFRHKIVDKLASVEAKVSNKFSMGVRDFFGNLNPIVLARQAEDHGKVFMSFAVDGGIKFNKDGLVQTFKQDASVAQALKDIQAFGQDAGMSFDQAKEYISSILEGHRAYDIQENHNKPLEVSAVLREQQGKNKEADAERAKKIDLHLTAADIASLEAKYQKTPAIKEIQDTFNKTRMHTIDLLAQSGRISKEQADDWKANSAYVPFDRVFEDLGVNLLPRGKGLGVMTKTPEIKGSLDRRVKNVVDSYMGTLGWMVEEAMRHNASVKLLNEMELSGFAEKHPTINAAKNKDLVVRLYKDGKPVFYEVQNEYDILAFKQAPEINNFLVNGLTATSKILRVSVTAMPPFAIKQVVEDATRAAFYSGVERPLVVAMKTLYNLPRAFFGEVTGRKSPVAKVLEQLGVIGDYDLNIYKPTTAIEKDIGAKKRGMAGAIFHTLEGFTKASDLAARMAVYEETIRDTKSAQNPEGDTLLAQTRARELINFQRRGSSGSMRVATRIIPFFNAYAQGMDVLYRSASGIDSSSSIERGAARRLFMGRVAMMTAMGFAYAIAMSDDDGYKEATDEKRDNNWLLPNNYKIPCPKELGFLFKVIPERIVEYMNRKGTPEEQSVMDALSGVMKAGYSAYSTPTTIPSYVRPVIENMANYSFFLQRELESTDLQKKLPGYRYTSTTSEVAKSLGEATNVSPIKIDNLLKGMFGMAGSTTLLITDAMLNPTRPDRPISQLPFASIFTYDTVGGRAKTEFYDLRERVSQADSTFKDLLKYNPEKAQKFLEENQSLIAMAPLINKSLKDLSETRSVRMVLEQGTDAQLGIDSAERRRLIDELRGYENDSLSYVRGIEKQMREMDLLQ